MILGLLRNLFGHHGYQDLLQRTAHELSSLPATMAWTPFLQPAPGVDRWWWLLMLPLSVGVAMSYKAIRTRDLRRFPREALVLAAQIVGGMAALAVFLFLLVQVLLPFLPAE